MILNSMPLMNRSSISIGNVEELGLSLVDGVSEYREAPAPVSDSSLQCLEMVGATYAYRDERERRFMLGPIDLRFQPGEVVFLTGGNGSGKTTLAKLLSGLYHPISGELRWNGAKIIDNDLDDYRQHISAVFSEPHVFETLLGIDGANLDDRAAQYLDEFQLRETVAVKNGKFSTVNLSRGQRKRLALLTAFLENREVYLFDEWAADQDPTFKEIFYRHILADLKARRKAVIVISHDDHYYSLGDRIIKLDFGRIVADSSTRHYHLDGVNE
jgi:putative ATP-binding cassette transporter